MGDPIRKLVAGGRIGYPGRDGQHLRQELSPAVIVAEIESGGRLIEQILQIRPRRSQSFSILLRPLPPDERIGIFAFVEHDDVDVEAFGNEQVARSRRGALAGRVGVVAEDRLST